MSFYFVQAMTIVYLLTFFGTCDLWKGPMPLLGCTAGSLFELIMHCMYMYTTVLVYVFPKLIITFGN